MQIIPSKRFCSCCKSEKSAVLEFTPKSHICKDCKKEENSRAKKKLLGPTDYSPSWKDKGKRR